MTSQTLPAFISHSRGWEVAKQHPCMAWMARYTQHAFNNDAVRKDSAEFGKWHTADFIHINADGTKYTGWDETFAALQQIYAPFTSFCHEPVFVNCWETEDGWEMVGQATMFADLPVPGGDKTHTDLTGKKWDLGLPGMFHFWYVKDKSGPDGIKMKRSDVFSDTFPAIQEMMKRGMIKA